MTVIVNLFVLGILSFIVFHIARAGLVDMQDGLAGTLFFTSVIVVYLIVIFEIVLQNLAVGKDHDSIIAFFKENDQKTFRGKPDSVVKAISWLATIGWGLLITLAAALKEALQAPLDTSLLDSDFSTLLNQFVVNPSWSLYIYFLTPLMTVVSALGLYLKSKRNKRKTDRYPVSLIALFLLSCIGMMILFI